MKFNDFCAALRCEAMSGSHGIGYAIPTIALDTLRAAAGDAGTLNHKQHYVILTFPADEGTAIISGALDTGRLENGWMFLLGQDQPL